MFQRFNAAALFGMVAAALANPTVAGRNVAMSNLPTYRSRGKGRGQFETNYVGRHGVSHFNGGPNGGREVARRRRQLAKGIIHANAP